MTNPKPEHPLPWYIREGVLRDIDGNRIRTDHNALYVIPIDYETHKDEGTLANFNRYTAGDR